PGTAIYIFFAMPPFAGYINGGGTHSGPITLFQHCQFLLDGVQVGEYSLTLNSAAPVKYNIPAYANATIPNGVHTFALQPSTDALNLLFFDYAIYTCVSLLNGR
ncbi:hypothetical protein B0H13DRAFT_1644372, partial [Mycena leptocephala]